MGVKNSYVSTNPTDPVSKTRLCYFLSIKMQNKKEKHRPSTKYLYFHKITGPTLFFSGEKIENKTKRFSYLPTKFLFSMLVETQLYFTPWIDSISSHWHLGLSKILLANRCWFSKLHSVLTLVCLQNMLRNIYTVGCSRWAVAIKECK